MAATTINAKDAASSASDLYASLNATKAKAKSTTADAQSRFLTLLTTQLKNQDPLNPMDNAQMTSQLAQISTVDGIEKLNATLTKMIDGQTQSQTVQAAMLVGHGVLVPASGMDLKNSAAIAGVELTGPADAVNVEIKDANGLVVRTLRLGEQDAGTTAFAWDGKSDTGAQAVDGHYSIAISATRGGDKVEATALGYGMVDSVVRDGQGLSVNVGSVGSFGMNDIKQIL